MRKRVAAGLALALFAPSLAFSRPALAAPPLTPPTATPKPTAMATGDMDPLTFTWVDGADGTLATDNDTAKQIHDLFAGITYLVLDNHKIQVGQTKNGTLTASFTMNEVHTGDNNLYLGHVLTKKNGTTSLLDGTIQRSSQDPTQGFAILTLVLIDDQGNVATTHIEQSLKFQKAAA